MRIPRIYQNNELTANTVIKLDKEAANHIGRVLRLNAKDKICLFNGNGYNYPSSITEVTKKSVSAHIDEKIENNNESPLTFHLGQVISRGDRMDFTLQKSVELGVTEITPLFSERCGVKLNAERLAKKIEQWQKIVVSACEQSGRSFVPRVNQAINVDDWISQSFAGTRLNLHPQAKQNIKQLQLKNEAVQLLIGPEGGLTDDEIDKANQQGFEDVLMGPRVLRTETAGLAAIAMLQSCFGDL